MPLNYHDSRVTIKGGCVTLEVVSLRLYGHGDGTLSEGREIRDIPYGKYADMARPETPSVTEKRALPELSTNISTMRKLVARFSISDSFSGLSQALGIFILYSRASCLHTDKDPWRLLAVSSCIYFGRLPSKDTYISGTRTTNTLLKSMQLVLSCSIHAICRLSQLLGED